MGNATTRIQPDVLALATEFLDQPGPEAFRRLEETVLRLFQLASSHVVAGILLLRHKNTAWVDSAVQEARKVAPRPNRLRGEREAPVHFLGGTRLKIETVYMSEDLRGRGGKRRGVGRRRQSGRPPRLPGVAPIYTGARPARRSTSSASPTRIRRTNERAKKRR